MWKVTMKYEVERNNFTLSKDYLKTMCWGEFSLKRKQQYDGEKYKMRRFLICTLH
jgi:hypothetical protein